MAGDESPLLLRLKARAGDPEPPVVGQVFDSLLRLEGKAAIPFLGEFLRSPSEDVRAEAALALGEGGFMDALRPLMDLKASDPSPEVRQAAAVALKKLAPR